jgi:hypothetical protein
VLLAALALAACGGRVAETPATLRVIEPQADADCMPIISPGADRLGQIEAVLEPIEPRGSLPASVRVERGSVVDDATGEVFAEFDVETAPIIESGRTTRLSIRKRNGSGQPLGRCPWDDHPRGRLRLDVSWDHGRESAESPSFEPSVAY